MKVPGPGYLLRHGDATFPLSPGKPYTVEEKDGSLRFSSERVPNKVVSRDPVRIICDDTATLAPHSGVEVDSIVAGRGFHWQKEITQTLPGDLEIHPYKDYLVLVNVVPFEQYLTCVVASEMSAECPVEFMQAQGVAARSWAYAFLKTKYENEPYTICNDDESQRYQGTTHLNQTTIDSLQKSRGEFLITADGAVCPAYYSKSCGGHTEDAASVFGFSVPGLSPVLDAAKDSPAATLNLTRAEDFSSWLSEQAVDGSGIYCSPELVQESDLKKYLGVVDVEDAYFRWEHQLTARQLISNLSSKFTIRDIEAILDLEAGPRGVSGRIFNLDITYLSTAGKKKIFHITSQYDIRKALHDSFLYSSAFIMNIARDDTGAVQAIAFQGSGWGHGAGLCQIGALGMALSGRSHHEILSHYYPGCSFVKAYE